jgi:exodeoxyribonuclease III
MCTYGTMQPMRIISWNVNGLRSLHTQGYWGTFCREQSFDVLCLQETKSDVSQLPPALRSPEGMAAFFSSSQVKKGYSGVATYTKTDPGKVEYGLTEERFDQEGRVITAYFGKLALLNVYVPNGGQGPHRLDYKFDFLDALLSRMTALKADGFSIVLCGDINIAHEAIDLAHPEAHEEHTGFLPEERAWVDELMNQGYIDIFRYQNPGKTGAYTFWDQRFHARARNAGWRIDYFFISPDLLPKVKSTTILSEVFGSDHCPVSLEVVV